MRAALRRLVVVSGRQCKSFAVLRRVSLTFHSDRPATSGPKERAELSCGLSKSVAATTGGITDTERRSDRTSSIIALTKRATSQNN